MKSYLFSVVLSVLTVATALAQRDPKLKNDVTYSTHNYKHPNKAAAARQWSGETTVPVRLPMAANRMVSNYKHPVQSPVPTSALVIPNVPQQDDANRNYKNQLNAAGMKAKPAEELSEKRDKPGSF